MNELKALTVRRDDLLAKIIEIEAGCEGVENERSARRVQELNLDHAQLSAQKRELSGKLSVLEAKLSAVNSEIAQLSGTGVDRILEAIKKQRWYFFKNKTKIIMDRDTGLLWANLNFFPYGDDSELSERVSLEGSAGESIPYDDFELRQYRLSRIPEIINSYTFDNYAGFRVPTCYEFWKMIADKTFPFHFGSHWQICNHHWNWAVAYNNSIMSKDTEDSGAASGLDTCDSYIIPCSSVLVDNNDYQQNINPNNPNYNEKERLMFTLDLFVQNDLWPVFDDEAITELFRKIYYEKPKLLEQLNELQTQIESLQEVVLQSSEFDCTALLAKYDIKAIDSSVIKYCQAVQRWTDELLEKLDCYESEKESVISEFNPIGLKLGKKYENSELLSDEENALLRERQRFFASRFSLGMTGVKSKLLAVKRQAEELEYRIDEIGSGDDAIRQLALLEKEERASFSFIAEYTAKIIRSALKKIEFFEANRQYVAWAVEAWEEWTEKYKLFRTICREELKSACEEDGVEDEVWQKWYEDWRALRFRIEQKFQPMAEHELRGRVAMIKEADISAAHQIIAELEAYRNAVDRFYREERKDIYRNFAFRSNGEIQDRLEAESKLYSLTAAFRKALQSIIFNCAKAEDRFFILNWADDLLDIQVDDVLAIIADNDLDKISETILTEFSELKKKNSELCLADANSYDAEQAKRDKRFNSLLFKMRKGLNDKKS